MKAKTAIIQYKYCQIMENLANSWSNQPKQSQNSQKKPQSWKNDSFITN